MNLGSWHGCIFCWIAVLWQYASVGLYPMDECMYRVVQYVEGWVVVVCIYVYIA